MQSQNLPCGTIDLGTQTVEVFYCSCGYFAGVDAENCKAHCRRETRRLVDLDMLGRHKLRVALVKRSDKLAC